MDYIEELVHKIWNLNLRQQQLVTNLVNEISSSDIEIQQPPRACNTGFISSNSIALAVGDKVRVLGNRKTGKDGDTTLGIKFDKILVAIELEKNKSRTQRTSKYLELL